MTETRKLRVFLCHASQDKPIVRDLRQRLSNEDWIETRFDEENLLSDINSKEVLHNFFRDIDVLLVCLSRSSVSADVYKDIGFVHALVGALEKHEDKIYIFPLRFDDCPIPTYFQLWQWLNYYEDNAENALLDSLSKCAKKLGITSRNSNAENEIENTNSQFNESKENTWLYQFVEVFYDSIDYPFWISQYPVTSYQYHRFLKSDDYAKASYWTDSPKYHENREFFNSLRRNEHYHMYQTWHSEWRKYLRVNRNRISKLQYHKYLGQQFKLIDPDTYVVNISWYEAAAYCKWLTNHWLELQEFKSLSNLLIQKTNLYTHSDICFRLPLDNEWILSVKSGETKPPAYYPNGRSPDKVVYIPSRYKEWLANTSKDHYSTINRFYGEMYVDAFLAENSRSTFECGGSAWLEEEDTGFRVVAVIKDNK